MPRYKPCSRQPLLLPVDLDEQLTPGSFAFALDHLVDNELDLSALDARFCNDEVGASAYDPRVMLKLVLLGYSQGLISSRAIERTCRVNVQFIAIGGDSQPGHAHIAKFVSSLGNEVTSLFAQVLLTCDRLGLIGRDLFAIDGVKLPCNGSKERSGTFEELRHRADRLDKAAAKIVAAHQSNDAQGGGDALPARRAQRVEALQREAQRTREFLARSSPRLNAKGQELKTNVTDPDSAKMATSKGVIQGYAAQAAVDAEHQIIVATDVVGSGSEQQMLLPLVEQSLPYRHDQTVITADAGYHSDANVRTLRDRQIPALVADNQMRKRDEAFADQQRYKTKEALHDKRAQAPGRFRPDDFVFHDEYSASCPAGHTLRSTGTVLTVDKGLKRQDYKADPDDCGPCHLRAQCLQRPHRTPARKVYRFWPADTDPNDPSERMRRAIDSPRGRALYSRRIATVEPVFANLRHNKRLSRFTLRGKAKVSTQWHLYCLVHNIEKVAKWL